jgi:CRP/FNR family transcriptional regulator, cyclic AMP receptor protein
MGRNVVHAAVAQELLGIPGFGGCSSRQLAQIDRLTDTVDIAPGRVVVQEGSIGREAYAIVSGSAAVTRNGRLLTTLSSGDLFGELGPIDVGRRNATLTAMSQLRVLTIGPREFTTLLADIPSFRDMLLRGMARRLRAADDAIASLTVISPPAPRTLAFQH